MHATTTMQNNIPLPVRPISSSSRSALAVMISTGPLPKTEVMPITSSGVKDGWASRNSGALHARQRRRAARRPVCVSESGATASALSALERMDQINRLITGFGLTWATSRVAAWPTFSAGSAAAASAAAAAAAAARELT